MLEPSKSAPLTNEGSGTLMGWIRVAVFPKEQSELGANVDRSFVAEPKPDC